MYRTVSLTNEICIGKKTGSIELRYTRKFYNMVFNKVDKINGRKIMPNTQLFILHNILNGCRNLNNVN